MTDLRFEVETRWSGSGGEAVGSVLTGGQVVAWSVPASMNGRGEGTSPEELLAAAVATCFTATLGALLSQLVLPWQRITVGMEETVSGQGGQDRRISRLRVTPTLEGADPTQVEAYQRTAQLARRRCFVGRHLSPEVSYEVGDVRLSSPVGLDGELDVRQLPPSQRHQLIFSSLDRLGQGSGLTLVNDHDPLPLRYQLEATRAGQFSWEYLQSGPQTWKVRIERQPA